MPARGGRTEAEGAVAVGIRDGPQAGGRRDDGRVVPVRLLGVACGVDDGEGTGGGGVVA